MNNMSVRFEMVLLPAAQGFIEGQPEGVQEKVRQVLRTAAQDEDIKYFKELREGIWEFRVQHLGDHFRLFAFWDESHHPPRVLVTHGWRKDVKRTPDAEIERAFVIKMEYEVKSA